MFDIFDVMAFVVFAVLLSAAVLVVVGLGSLPGSGGRRRGHPQATAVNVAGWLGIAALGPLRPFAPADVVVPPHPAGVARGHLVPALTGAEARAFPAEGSSWAGSSDAGSGPS